MPDIVVLHAPSPLGLAPPGPQRIPGCRHAPAALQRLGLHAAIGAPCVGEVAPDPYAFARDPRTGLRNGAAVAAYAGRLGDALAPLLRGTAFPLVLGGDCSIALGVARALASGGRRFGLLYLDAHSDCQTPAISETGGIAGMPLAALVGTAPEVDGLAPSLDPSRAVLLGVRDLFDVEGEGDARRIVGAGVRVRDLDEIRRDGPAAAGAAALADLRRADVDVAWVHLDVDVLDPAVMPAVDSPDPGGLTAAELTTLLHTLLASPLVGGMHLTIYDPERDPDGAAGRHLVRVLAEALAAVGVRTPGG